MISILQSAQVEVEVEVKLAMAAVVLLFILSSEETKCKIQNTKAPN